MNKMPAEVAQTPSEQADVTQSPVLGESLNAGPTGSVKSKTPDVDNAPPLHLSSSSAASSNRESSFNSTGQPFRTNGDSRGGADGGSADEGGEYTTESPSTTEGVTGADRGTAHFYRRQNDRVPRSGGGEENASGVTWERPGCSIQQQWRHVSTSCDLHGFQQARGALGASQRRAEYRDRHGGRDPPDRPMQHDPVFGPLPYEWSRTNGSNSLHQNGTTAAPSAGDDMENYFNANAHLLAYLELNDDSHEPNGTVPPGDLPHGRLPLGRENGIERSPHGSSHCDVRRGYNAMNGDVCMRPHSHDLLSNNSEDQGDFIEPDLCPGSQETDEGSGSQFWSSEEELPHLTPTTSTTFNASYTSSTNSPRQVGHQRLGHRYNSDSVKKPTDGPKLVAPPLSSSSSSSINSGTNSHVNSVCDYKKHKDQEVPRPASFGASNRLCTCSVVSYSLGRPDLTSSHSMSSGEVDEGVGGMKVSPADPSPSESEGGSGVPCGITVTSDSSSYFSPEDVDFMDFDMEPAMATPSDNDKDFCTPSSNIPYNNHHHHHHHLHHDIADSGSSPLESRQFYEGAKNASEGDGSMISCEDCRKPDRDCLCQSLHVCKRLLEVAKNNEQQQAQGFCDHMNHSGDEYVCYEHQDNQRLDQQQHRLNNLQAPINEAPAAAGQCGCFNNEIGGGNDSGAGSQEHLDDLSSDDQADDLDLQPACPTRSCNCPVSRYYMGAPLCDQHDLYCHDTNNLDVEVFNAPSSDYEDELFNVSRQTSTSNFDQDENAYQDAVEDLASNGFHSACSGSDLESEKNNHSSSYSNHLNHTSNNRDQPLHHLELNQEIVGAGLVGEGTREGAPFSYHSKILPLNNPPPEIPLPIPSRGEESPRRRPPSIPPPSDVSDCMDAGELMEGRESAGIENSNGQRPSWSTQSSDDISPVGALNWSDYDVAGVKTDASRPNSRPMMYLPSLGEHNHNNQPMLLRYGGSPLDQDYLNSPTDNLENGRLGVRAENTMYQENSLVHQDLGTRPEFMVDGEVPFPDPITHIFILNLLREKESRSQASASPSQSSIEKVMIWSEYDAYVTQVKQIGTSACGATAVINVLKALEIYMEKAVVSRAVSTNLRAEQGPLPEYLFSRSVAGCTAEHLIQGVQTVTEGRVYGRFFCFHPERDIDILPWLGEWMKRGAVPILTLNLQKAVPQGWEIPDAWHHQMAYGIGPKGVYLTNPLELVPEEVIREQLTCESELLVRRHDIISRWSDTANLGQLLTHQDPRWRQMNVLGQVVNILREARQPRVMGFRPQLTTHIRIPAWYRAGISLFVHRDSEAYLLLRDCPELSIRVASRTEPTEQEEEDVFEGEGTPRASGPKSAEASASASASASAPTPPSSPTTSSSSAAPTTTDMDNDSDSPRGGRNTAIAEARGLEEVNGGLRHGSSTGNSTGGGVQARASNSRKNDAVAYLVPSAPPLPFPFPQPQPSTSHQRDNTETETLTFAARPQLHREDSSVDADNRVANSASTGVNSSNSVTGGHSHAEETLHQPLPPVRSPQIAPRPHVLSSPPPDSPQLQDLAQARRLSVNSESESTNTNVMSNNSVPHNLPDNTS